MSQIDQRRERMEREVTLLARQCLSARVSERRTRYPEADLVGVEEFAKQLVEAIIKGEVSANATIWKHHLVSDLLYYCPSCHTLSSVPVFCLCFPDKVRQLSVTLALRAQ